MIKKILNVLKNIVLSIFVFYFFVSLILIPLAAPFVIKSQAGKILNHKVNVKGVTFNPFLWRVSLRGFDILDTAGQSIVGFKRFSVDVSFLSLLKKKYRLEAVILDGLKVNAVMAAGNKINLLDLVPQSTPSNADAQKVQENASSGQADSAQEALPLVFVDLVSVTNGEIKFTDQTITPVFITSLSNINFTMTGFSTNPDTAAKIVFKANLGEKGLMEAQALVKPLMIPPQLDATYSLNSYALEVLTPYVGKYTGRAVRSGKFDLKMDYRIEENTLTAKHKIVIQQFDFGDKVESKDALNLPFGLAVALLEDPEGKIKIGLPVSGNLNDPQFHYFHLVGQVLSNFFVKLLTKPFAFLVSSLGGQGDTDESTYTVFSPGKTEMSDDVKQKLSTLIAGLKERPKLSLEINGGYDPVVDWKAIKEDVFRNDYSTLEGESMKEAQIYQMLYQRRFGIRDLWALAKKYKVNGQYDYEKLNAEIKRQLIEDGSADKLALEVLAQKRAQTVYDFILQAGFDANRLTMGQVREVQSTMGEVPLEFTLTVFESTPQQ